MGGCHSQRIAISTNSDDGAEDFAKALQQQDEEALRKVLVRRSQQHNVTASAITYVNDKGKAITAFAGAADVDKDALFQAASTSKAVSAATILTLAEQKGISIDEDIRKYVTTIDISTEIKGGNRQQPVTLRQLLSHTAGATVSGFSGYPRAIPKRYLPNSREIIFGAHNANSPAVQLTGKIGEFLTI